MRMFMCIQLEFVCKFWADNGSGLVVCMCMVTVSGSIATRSNQDAVWFYIGIYETIQVGSDIRKSLAGYQLETDSFAVCLHQISPS